MTGRRLFLVFEERTTRKVLEDSSSLKWARSFKFLTETTRGMNLIAEANNGPRWKHVRKSTSTAFSPANIQLMIQHIDEIVENWINEKLEPLVKEENPIDILAEMYFVTAQIIMKAAFGY